MSGCNAATPHMDTHMAVHQPHSGGIQTKPDSAVFAPFDIVHTKIKTVGNEAVFHMSVSGIAGEIKPNPIGQLGGSDVYAYVWPTTMDSYVVGFERDAGILALVATSHPDFDDTPLYDENNDGDNANDGGLWHSHWVVLKPNEQCGEGALGVVDIPEGVKPRLPKTWPGFPILLDSPKWKPAFNADSIEIRVPFDDISVVTNARFDGVTAGLRVHQSIHAPLLCVVDVKKIASGDLSLPGTPNQ
ncbi:MAG: hypothetical protein COA43_05265 [Robiginitomaculum sp.]|nr:MAG: hypothetical protein COA43_05265 [Robiginitomaculum sp.]